MWGKEKNRENSYWFHSSSSTFLFVIILVYLIIKKYKKIKNIFGILIVGISLYYRWLVGGSWIVIYGQSCQAHSIQGKGVGSSWSKN